MRRQFASGDRVHVARLGTGIVREVRNGGRYLIELKGRAMVVDAGQLEAAEPARTSRTESVVTKTDGGSTAAAPAPSPSIDLHGKTVEEALAALDEFLNDALLDGAAEATVIHGRSGGKLKAAVHARLKDLPPVRAFRLDPHNPGATIVTF
jgi:DNA mismatch repair protein MutS2